MANPDYILYVLNDEASSRNAATLTRGGDNVRITTVDLNAVPRDQRPAWLRGAPTLVQFTPQADGVWRGPVWEGIYAIRKLREVCPKGVEMLTTTLAADTDDHVVEVEEGNGQSFVGMEAEPREGEEGMTEAEGLFTMSESSGAAQCQQPVNGADNMDDLNAYVQQCIERRQKDMPVEEDD